MIQNSQEREVERLRTLRLYRIMDSGSDQAFDDLTQLASSICGTPISLISLVEENRQWFKSRVGLEVMQTPRDVSFCAHAILEEHVLVVEDALHDERFSLNPLVTSAPGIRFYAGAPLTMANGMALGTLCVIDREPRKLIPSQIEALKVLAKAVVTQMELRRTLAELRDMEALLNICAWCRNIQDADGSWLPLYEYAAASRHATHGMCPECYRNAKME